MKNSICLAIGFNKIKLIQILLDKGLLDFVIYPDTIKYKSRYQDIINFCSKNNIKTIKFHKNGLENLSQLDLKNKYLYSSGFPYIFSYSDLKKFRSCINYHPVDLPEFPGRYIHNALLSSRRYLNGTLHLMDAGCDSGKIIRKFKFKRDVFDSVNSIYRKAYLTELNNLKEIINLILIQKTKPKNENKNKNMQKQKIASDSEINKNSTILQVFKKITTVDQDLYPVFFNYKGRKVIIKMHSIKKEFEDEI